MIEGKLELVIWSVYPLPDLIESQSVEDSHAVIGRRGERAPQGRSRWVGHPATSSTSR